MSETSANESRLTARLDRWYPLIVILLIIVGAAARLIHLTLIDASVPFTLGGLYVEFAQQIAANAYRLPATIPFYTDGGLPFAYPPLVFYAIAVLIHALGVDPFTVVVFLPPLIAILTLPSFVILTRQLELSRPTQIVALAGFALLPSAFAEPITSDGLVEAFGLLALIWVLIAAARAYRSDSWRTALILAGLWGVGALISPGLAYGLIPLMIVVGAADVIRAQDRGWVLRRWLVIGAVALIVAAPYWLAVITTHGPGVFTATLINEQGGLSTSLLRPLAPLVGVSNPAALPTTTFWSGVVWNGLIYLGLIYALFTRRWLFALTYVIFSAIPREGSWMVTVPAAVLAALALTRGLIPLINGWARDHLHRRARRLLSAGVALLLAANIVGSAALTLDGMRARAQIRPAHVALMQQIAASDTIPAAARFIVVDIEPVIEWFPQLARRTTLNVRFGAEWRPDEQARINALNGRIGGCRDLDCVFQAAHDLAYAYDPLYLLIGRAALSRLEPASTLRAEIVLENETAAVLRLSSES
ncbi:MAG: hypothetical protein GYB67_16905 [Chloroflexi bacterium]|nr:hypothetical protein [Chloroflexota bacterium]